MYEGQRENRMRTAVGRKPVDRWTTGRPRRHRWWTAAATAVLALAVLGVSSSAPPGSNLLAPASGIVDADLTPATLFAPRMAHAQGRDPRFRPTLIELEDVAQLQARFQADDGLPRLLLVFSPT
jgi:hypothetical protein